jgi:monoterpene epsilon-lactone hydrolase
MASTQSGAVAAMYRGWTEARLHDEPNDPEAWGDLTAEPRGTDYVETDAGGLPAMWVLPKGHDPDAVLLCLHGGGFVGGSIYTHRKLFGHLAKAVGARALLVDYRLAPAHVFPAQLDDATIAYKWLLDQGAGHVAVAGDSSGGGLALALMLRARAEGVRLPAAGVLISPWVDMALTGASYETNAATETFFFRDVVAQLAELYLGGTSPTSPLASPLHADLTGLPPLYVQVGVEETLLDDSRLLAERARAAGVVVRLDVFAQQQHSFQMAAGRAPEADDAIARFAAWARPLLGIGAR